VVAVVVAVGQAASTRLVGLLVFASGVVLPLLETLISFEMQLRVALATSTVQVAVDFVAKSVTPAMSMLKVAMVAPVDFLVPLVLQGKILRLLWAT
jgi:hypothetical protein